jgi:lipopolysaccharide transport system ATP-binding protein
MLATHSNPTPAPAIQLDRVGLYYSRNPGALRISREKLWVLKDISLKINQGETIGVIGRNGAGKSTLMKLLAGIMAPDNGRIHIADGLSITLLSLQAGFNPHLSGRENVLLSGMLMGLPRKEILQRMPEIIAFAELEKFIEAPLRTYSAGMRARLGFASALYLETEVMLLDEVLAVGDADFVEKCRKHIESKIRGERTVVMVSHSEHNLKGLCPRLVWLDNAQIKADGPFEDIWSLYRDTYRKSMGLR